MPSSTPPARMLIFVESRSSGVLPLDGMQIGAIPYATWTSETRGKTTWERIRRLTSRTAISSFGFLAIIYPPALLAGRDALKAERP